jgi:hypothetical protein
MKSKLEVIQLKDCLKLTMPDEVLDKIKLLCQEIPKVEWSGVLFYSIVGSIKEPNNMEIILNDILPMDKGTSSFTSYNIDDRLLDYYSEKPGAMDLKMGHIHSHNTMSVFFSGTDMEELTENADSHNFYLSLIVNNFMDFTAKVGFIANSESKIVNVSSYALDENGEKYEIESNNIKIESKKCFTYDCDIISSIEDIVVTDEYFLKGLKAIQEVKSFPIGFNKGISRTWDKNKQQFVDYSGQDFFTPVKNVNDYLTTRKNHGYNDYDDYNDSFNNWNGMSINCSNKIKKLILTTFKNSNKPENGIDVEKFLVEACLDKNKKNSDLSEEIFKSFEAYYLTVFESIYADTDMEEFQQVTENVIEVLEENVTIFPFLEKTINYLESIIEILDEK